MMWRVGCAPLASAVLLIAFAAHADDTAQDHARRVELGAKLDFGFPIGAIERGTLASDLSYGGIQIAADAAYALSHAVALGALAGYTVAIPKLCASAADCTSSLGHDIGLAVLGRVHLPYLAWVRPNVEAAAGYMWSSRTLSDHGVQSTRSDHGPLLYLAFIPTLAFSKRWEFGVVIATQLAIATRIGLEAPGVSVSRSSLGTRVNGSVNIGARIGARL